jgi:hypothetical protein
MQLTLVLLNRVEVAIHGLHWHIWPQRHTRLDPPARCLMQARPFWTMAWTIGPAAARTNVALSPRQNGE